MRRLRRALGVSAADFNVYDRASEAKRLPGGSDYLHRQVLRSPSTDDLDAATATGLARLLRSVDHKWLTAESEKQYRLGHRYLNSPLHLMGGLRVGTGSEFPGPQRFARMLLLAKDYLAKDASLDFFSAAMFVPEIAALGNSLDDIRALGPEAQRKLAALPTLSDDLVTSTIFKLIVGAALLRRGLNVEMVRENRSRAAPDYRITGLGAIPGAVECKRRLGLSAYEVEEARHLELLYRAIRPELREKGIHSSIEVSFSVPVRQVQVQEFASDVLSCVKWNQERDPQPMSWGSVGVRRLPHFRMLWQTRLYSPDFLKEVFDWQVLQSEWDGIICEVDPPLQILVESLRSPMCLKWRSDSTEAFSKKSRGITALWGSAIKQIPPGDIGFVYIAYPEGSRPALADARTQNIISSMEESWHRWFVRVPVTVISRLYPRPIGGGQPDLIESSLSCAAKGQEHWLTYLPWLIFTRQFQDEE